MNRNLFIGAALSFFWTPYDIETLDIANKLQGFSPTNWLGTDHFGRDILSMIMMGARTSIAVALLAVGIGVTLGIPLGLTAAARRGSVLDELIMRGNDLVFAFPSLIIAILITAVFGASAINAIIAIGIFNIPVFARLTRAAALPPHTSTRSGVPDAASFVRGTSPRRSARLLNVLRVGAA